MKRTVNFVVPKIVSSVETSEISFEDALQCVVNLPKSKSKKTFTVKTFGHSIENCKEGYVITEQNKDLPPKRNRTTGELTSLGLDLINESLAYANVFLYNSNMNVLLYEVNGNGCYLDDLGDIITDVWNADTNHQVKIIEMNFVDVITAAEYQKMASMNYFKEFHVVVTCPSEIKREYSATKRSSYSNIKSCINQAASYNSDILDMKFSAFGKKVTPSGLSNKRLRQLANGFRFLLEGNQRKNVKKLTIKGYATDSEDSRSIQTIDLIANVVKGKFDLPDVILNDNLQEVDRKQGIEQLYNEKLPMLTQIFQR